MPNDDDLPDPFDTSDEPPPKPFEYSFWEWQDDNTCEGCTHLIAGHLTHSKECIVCVRSAYVSDNFKQEEP